MPKYDNLLDRKTLVTIYVHESMISQRTAISYVLDRAGVRFLTGSTGFMSGIMLGSVIETSATYIKRAPEKYGKSVRQTIHIRSLATLRLHGAMPMPPPHHTYHRVSVMG
jgi:hypothetical protein